MNNANFIIVSYAVSFALILWLILSTWLSSRRTIRQLNSQQDRSSS